MEHTVNGFAATNVQHCPMLMIDELTNARSSPLNAALNVERGYFKRNLGTREFYRSRPGFKIDAFASALS
jgi:hypothetical protein